MPHFRIGEHNVLQDGHNPHIMFFFHFCNVDGPRYSYDVTDMYVITGSRKIQCTHR